jgi:hypothetical protein
MQKFINKDSALRALFEQQGADWITSPNAEPEGTKGASRSRSHGDFDDDQPTLQATLARILDRTQVKAEVKIRRSARSVREFGRSLAMKTDRAQLMAVR